jgi:hypothetical protein
MSYADYEWFLKSDLNKYSGNWIAIIDKQVVASDKDPKQLVQKTKKKFPNKKPVITLVKDKLSIL